MGPPSLAGTLLATLVLSLASSPASSSPGLARNRRALGGSGKLGDGYWSVQGKDFVDSNGNVVRFSGVIWSGFECPEAIVHGLHVGRTYGSHLDQIKSLGFNVIRLPFAGDTLLKSTYPQGGWVGPNPDLQGLTSLEVMDKIIEAAGHRGIRIILDYHRLHLTYSNELGTWFDNNTPENVWIDNWAMLAKRYKGNPTIIGADLFNEVHHGDSMPEGAPYWVNDAGENEKYNFRSATLRVIDAIRAQEPNWILFQEGMGNHYWWGGNVAQLRRAPISKPKKKLAYSAHEYGPYVASQGWFDSPDFPSNLKPLFRKRWGFAIEKGIAPVWVGEFGSFYPPNDSHKNYVERTTFETLISYIDEIDASWTIAFWGPDSKDTGGILTDDWHTVHQQKLDLLKPIMHSDFK